MRNINWNLAGGKSIVWLFLVAAAGLSFHDIVTLFERIGVPHGLSFLAPVFIDGVAWLGKIMRSHTFSRGTNITGLVYLGLGGSASLAANLAAGETLGMKLLGVLAVTSFVAGEVALDKIEAREATAVKDEVAKRTAARVTPAELAARKRAGYDKLDAKGKARWTTEYRARMAKKTSTTAPAAATPELQPTNA